MKKIAYVGIDYRSAFKESAKRTKHQINSLLLSHDFRWPKSKWTQAHPEWISQIKMSHVYMQQATDKYLCHLQYLESRLQNLKELIEEIAKYTDVSLTENS